MPLFIDPDEADYRETGRELIELFVTHLGEPKADIDIVGFWTPKYVSSKLEKVRQADGDTLYVVSEHLVCAGEDVGVAAGRVVVVQDRHLRVRCHGVGRVGCTPPNSADPTRPLSSRSHCSRS